MMANVDAFDVRQQRVLSDSPRGLGKCFVVKLSERDLNPIVAFTACDILETKSKGSRVEGAESEGT